MIYNRFYIAVIFQAALFAVLAYLAIWAQFREHLKFTGIGFALMAFGSLAILVVLVIGHNKRIIKFLNSYLINESYPKFNSLFRDQTFVLIEQQLNRVADSYSQVKMDKEAQQHLLNYIIQFYQHLHNGVEIPPGGIPYPVEVLRPCKSGQNI